MKKADFVTLLAERTGCTKKLSEEMLDTVLESIGDVLADGDRLNFIGFGSFETKYRAPRTVHLPTSEQAVLISEARLPVFRPGKKLKQKVEKS